MDRFLPRFINYFVIFQIVIYKCDKCEDFLTLNEIELDTHIRCAHAMEPSEPLENFTMDSGNKESILTSDEVSIIFLHLYKKIFKIFSYM